LHRDGNSVSAPDFYALHWVLVTALRAKADMDGAHAAYERDADLEA
jgi:hypothetical protein